MEESGAGKPENGGGGGKVDAAGNRTGAGALTAEERRAAAQGSNRPRGGGAGGAKAPVAAIVPPRAAYTGIPGLARVQFEFDRDELTDKAKRDLDRNAQWMLDHQDMRVRVEGHCDERGSNEYNLGLGQRRADRVTTYLITKGVRSTQMLAVSFGEEIPVAAGHDEAAWSQNRRVDFSNLDENSTGQVTTRNEQFASR
jgi:peptidoglycan-associated lipoprotein